MKPILLLFAILFINVKANAQCFETDKGLFINPEMPPEYPTGINGLRKEIQNYVGTDWEFDERKKRPVLVLQFEVCLDGSIGDIIKIPKEIENCGACSETGEQAIESLKYKFKPGKWNGQPRDVWFTMSVMFE